MLVTTIRFFILCVALLYATGTTDGLPLTPRDGDVTSFGLMGKKLSKLGGIEVPVQRLPSPAGSTGSTWRPLQVYGKTGVKGKVQTWWKKVSGTNKEGKGKGPDSY